MNRSIVSMAAIALGMSAALMPTPPTPRRPSLKTSAVKHPNNPQGSKARRKKRLGKPLFRP